jgi:hypothetical protein
MDSWVTVNAAILRFNLLLLRLPFRHHSRHRGRHGYIYRNDGLCLGCNTHHNQLPISFRRNLLCNLGGNKRKGRHILALKQREGIVIGMVLMVVSILVVGIAWIVTMPMAVIVWQSINPMLPAEDMPIMNMLNNVCGWTLLVLIIGCLAYGAALVYQRVYYDTPRY